jgi:D-amino-acid dehydrogenase
VTGARPCFRLFAGNDITRVRSGPRPVTPDGLPAPGRATGTANANIVNGHAIQGVSLPPGSGQALAQLILTGEADPMPADFSPGRFAGGLRRYL